VAAMIKNEKQYRVTQSQTKKFEEALTQLTQNLSKNKEVHPLLLKAQQDALQSQLNDLREELLEYEALKSGQREILELHSLDELPNALIKSRIASGLTQKELAERIGIKEQQIQRYEATEYASASFTRILEIVQILGIQIRKDVFLPNSEVSLKTLFNRLNSVGIEREFINKRLLPQSIDKNLETDNVSEETGSLALRIAGILDRVFRLRPADIFSSRSLQLDTAAIGSVRFKLAKGANEKRLTAYTVYAHYLALLVLDATSDLAKKPVPTNPNEVREAILSTYGSLTFEHALRYIWSLGIPVLPLKDSGAFHGAFWRVQGRNVIVLKQQTQSASRWLFDVLHELWHTAQEPELDERTIIEDSETAQERRNSEEETTASRFAGYITLNGRDRELADLCVKEAEGSIEKLKQVVTQVAAKENVSVGSLANYMAFRLSLQEENWWGTAINLQKEDIDSSNPWQTARDILLEQINFGKLNQVDRNLLMQALCDV
jgi:transcriptional regulator with XRE-family HTH domain/Zn-dependent peptidase ImmA (M78 family)